MTELLQAPPQDIIRGVRPAQRAVNATLQSDGVRLVLDAVSEEEETDLLALVDAGRWDCSLSRRVQHYGHRFAYSTKTCVPVAEPPPPAFTRLAERIRPVCWGADGGRDGDLQCTVNEYLPGQGISPHIDAHAAFGDGLVAVTLGAGCAIRLQRNRRHEAGAPIHTLWLPPRSALVLSGAARYVYTHGIVSRKGDLVDGEWRLRGRRVSLTFRRLPPPGPCACGFPESCDASGTAPKLLPTRLRGSAGGAEPRGCDAKKTVCASRVNIPGGPNKYKLEGHWQTKTTTG